MRRYAPTQQQQQQPSICSHHLPEPGKVGTQAHSPGLGTRKRTKSATARGHAYGTHLHACRHGPHDGQQQQQQVHGCPRAHSPCRLREPPTQGHCCSFSSAPSSVHPAHLAAEALWPPPPIHCTDAPSDSTPPPAMTLVLSVPLTPLHSVPCGRASPARACRGPLLMKTHTCTHRSRQSARRPANTAHTSAVISHTLQPCQKWSSRSRPPDPLSHPAPGRAVCLFQKTRRPRSAQADSSQGRLPAHYCFSSFSSGAAAACTHIPPGHGEEGCGGEGVGWCRLAAAAMHDVH